MQIPQSMNRLNNIAAHQEKLNTQDIAVSFAMVLGMVISLIALFA